LTYHPYYGIFSMIMNQIMVTTNLRIPYSDWIQIKTMAAESGMSVNEYIRLTVQGLSNIRSLVGHWVNPKKGALTIWDLPKLSKGENKPLGISADDELIYG